MTQVAKAVNLFQNIFPWGCSSISRALDLKSLYKLAIFLIRIEFKVLNQVIFELSYNNLVNFYSLGHLVMNLKLQRKFEYKTTLQNLQLRATLIAC
jgi:hypothetical protein